MWEQIVSNIPLAVLTFLPSNTCGMVQTHYLIILCIQSLLTGRTPGFLTTGFCRCTLGHFSKLFSLQRTTLNGSVHMFLFVQCLSWSLTTSSGELGCLSWMETKVKSEGCSNVLLKSLRTAHCWHSTGRWNLLHGGGVHWLDEAFLEAAWQEAWPSLLPCTCWVYIILPGRGKCIHVSSFVPWPWFSENHESSFQATNFY